MKKIMSTALLFLGLIGHAVGAAVVPGVWNTDFQAVKNYSEANHVPMLVFLGATECDHCQTLINNAIETTEFKKWQAERQLAMAFCEVEGTITAVMKTDAYKWFKAQGGVAGGIPMIGVSWPKADGTTSTSVFLGRSGQMPVKTGTLVRQLIDSIELTVGSYGKYSGGEFVVGTTPSNRLEAVENGGTAFVDVPLTRDDSDCSVVETGALVSIAAGLTNSYPVAWAESEVTKTVRIALPNSLAAGSSVKLLLKDPSGNVLAESSIAIVAKPANSVLNPSWHFKDFKVGEWTLNYAAATNAVKSGVASKLLVLFDGSLWCPYCKGLEASLLDSEEFPQWAKNNQVALMQFDQGRASSPATAAGTRAPRLVTYEPDPKTSGSATVSGASYVSRNMVEPVAANAAIDLTTHYTEKFLAPGSTAARMSQPSFLLVKNESVVGRFTAWRDSDKNYDTTENMGRLNDFLELWKRDDESSDYLSTTKRTHAIGGVDSASFQISDRNEYFQLTGGVAGNATFEVTPDAGHEVVVRLYADGKSVAEGTNRLETVLTAKLLATDLHVGLSAYPDTSVRFFADLGWGTTRFNAKLTSKVERVPGEVAFRDESLQVMKQIGSNEVVICRNDGCSGAVTFKIKVGEGSAENGIRYTWDENKVYSWADGEFDPISVWFEMDQERPYETNETVRLELVPVSGAAQFSETPLEVTLCDTDDPVTPKTDYQMRLYTGFNAATDENLTVYNLKGGKVSLKKVSGKLPRGVSLKYDAESQSLVLSGSPTQVSSATAVYVIVEKIGSGRSAETVTGPAITFTFDVCDPSEENPYLSQAFTTTLPIFRATATTNEMAGIVTLSATAKNALSAKFVCLADSKNASLSGKWQSLSEGVARAVLSKGQTEIELELTADGIIKAEVTDTRYLAEELTSGELSVLTETERLNCAGFYTMALIGPEGVGYLTLDMSSNSKAKSGLMSYSGALPNGRSVSGSTYLCGYDNDFVLVSIFLKTSRYALSVPVKLRRNAALAAVSSDGSNRAMINLEGAMAFWNCSEGLEGECAVYGSYFDSSVELVNYFGAVAARLSLDAGLGAEAVGDGSAVTIGNGKLTLLYRTSGLTLSYAKKTGKVSGTTKVTVGTRKCTGRFAGVVLPGWDECGSCGSADLLIPALVDELPVVVGQLTYDSVCSQMLLEADETVLNEAVATVSLMRRAGDYVGITIDGDVVSTDTSCRYEFIDKTVGALSANDVISIATGLGSEVLPSGEDIQPIAVTVVKGEVSRISLSGISGLRYSGGYITGRVSKPGLYAATLKVVSTGGITLTLAFPVVVE